MLGNNMANGKALTNAACRGEWAPDLDHMLNKAAR